MHLDDYIALGWYLFPIQPGTKIPYAETRGHLDATNDPALIRAFPVGANVAVSLEPSRLYVLDVDVSEGKNGADALTDLGSLSVERIQKTGRGGLQAFYSRPNGVIATRKVNLPTLRYPGKEAKSGIDLFGNGYVLLPPSTLSGEAFQGAAPGATGAYSWLAQGALVPLPPVLREFLSARATATLDAFTGPFDPAPESVLQAARERLLRHGPAISGQGGNAHTRAAWGILVHGFGLSDLEAWPLIQEWNATCRPPWHLDELRRGPARSDQNWIGARGEMRNAVESAELIRGVLGDIEPEPGEQENALPDLGPAPTQFQNLLSWSRAQVAKHLGEDQTTEQKPLFMTGHEVLAAEVPPTQWLVRGLIEEGGQVVVGGEPKTNKTWVLCEIALAIATGTPVFGTQPTGAPKRVAYFFAEDGLRAVRARFTALAASKGIPVEDAFKNLLLCPRGRFLDLTRDQDLALVIASCRMHGEIDTIILEPLRDLHSGEEDSSDAMGPLFKRLRVIAEIIGAAQGKVCTPVVAHHMKKASGDGKPQRGGQRLRGSGAMHGSLVSGIYLSEVRAEISKTGSVFRSSVESELKNGRSMGNFDLVLTIEDGADDTAEKASWSVEGSGSAPSTDNTEERIIGLIKVNPEKCISRKALYDAVKGNRGRFDTTIGVMLASGRLLVAERHPVHGSPMPPRLVLGPNAEIRPVPDPLVPV